MKKWVDFYGDPVEYSFFISELYSHTKLILSVIEERPTTILEVGVGSGKFSIFFSWLGVKVTGIDNNKKIVRTATLNNRKLNGTAFFHVADAYSLPYKANTFDCAFSHGFFEHFNDDAIVALLQEQLRVAKTVIFTVPNNYYRHLDLGNERLLSAERWDNLLRRGGFKFKSKDYLIRNLSLRCFTDFRYLIDFILRHKVFFLAKVHDNMKGSKEK